MKQPPRRDVLTARVRSNHGGWRARVLVACTFVLALSSLLVPGLAAAQDNSIQDVTTTQQGGNLIVRIAMKSAPTAAPASFSVATPPRIALDFVRTSNDTGKNAIEANQGDLRSVNLVTSGDRTRLVLNLKRSVAFTSAVDGNAVVVTLTPGIAEGGASNSGSTRAPTTRFAEATPNAQAHSIRDIDFRRAPDGSGRVIIDLSDSQTGTDIRTQGQSIVIDFLKTALPDSLRRRLDVTDFATPVQNVNTFTQGDNVRMVIEPRGLWEHNAYQTDNRLVVEVKPLKEDPNKLFQTSRAGYKGERLSLNFQNVDVRSLLQVIADFTNLNIITSDSVNGNLTLRLKDVPWDQALDIVLQAKGLDMRKNGNVILVAPKDELAAKEKLDLEARSQIADLEPLRSETFQLNYQKAQELVDFLNGTGTAGGTAGTTTSNRVLSRRGAASADVRTNQVFILETATKLDQIRAVVAKLDVPSRQVIIESRIVEANDQFSRNLGVKLGFNNTSTVVPDPNRGLGYRVTGNYLGAGEQTGQTTAQGTSFVPDTQFFSLPAAGINGLNPAAVGISLFTKSASKFLNLELSALEADGTGKIVSSPRVVTADSVKALIEQGTELPYQVATSSGATSIQFRKANLKLEVTPQITPEGNIILDVDVTKDSVGQVTTAGFAIDTKHVNTKVLVENGGTVVLGGIFQLTDNNTITKVPLLGDVPVLGYLFRNTAKSTTKSELLIFITPTTVNGQVVLR